MCGRYANHVTQMGDWADILGDWPADISSSYNVAPTQTVPVFYKNRVMGNTKGIGMRWGLVPAWSKEINPKFATFNARSESMAEKPSFRTAWKKSQTCLIPALGYYEWKGPKGEKQPYFIRMANQEPLVMAGLWDYYQHGDQGLFSCTIITQPAEGSLTEVHSRMPVMVARYHAEAWLDDGANRFNLIAKQQHTDRLEFYPVDKAVNRASSDNENLILKQKSL
jgi:putative SOS response-associated peptidase YedK